MNQPATQSHRIAFGVEYDGARFSGWQKQASPELPTVQGALESALGKIADHEIALVCAGRTDAGVHATGQVAHFDCAIDRGIKAWVTGTNSMLPESVRVQWAATVSPDFHARFSAEARRYQYVILRRPVTPAILAGKVTHVREALDVAAMHNAAQTLVGEQDFSSFRAAGCQSKTAMRRVIRVSVTQRGAFIVLDIEANAFLQHMVRNIAGALMAIGRGEYPVQWLQDLLAMRDRTAGEITAVPHGLYLVQVRYPAGFGLPAGPVEPVFLNAVQAHPRIG